ncbi:D-alanyl-D-alanine dipeptidase [Paenibacillus beijingensis]|uniref:D-alanyl-D-alanine dipeptidase n=1 Tax=Paenibacillus beijingensis TaxID=1126833 RepID=A0A0D5NQU2_9BACL|nr:D-alanyl-D-alanine dipeptidase [Paenibacillus beijingensis]
MQETGEPLVSLSDISPRIKVLPYYFHHNVPGALNDCYLRAGAAQRLALAAENLPDGCCFVVLDGWRPSEVQRALYETIRESFRRKGMNESEVARELAKFVAYPSDNVDMPSPHMTGGAVDLTIADPEGWLDMGTGFDEFTVKARTDWYERAALLTETELKIRTNRRLLKQVMANAGFENYDEEWWHYDYGNQRWAMLTGGQAIYKGVRK